MARTRPQDVFGTKDKTKPLGREAKSGVETQIGKIATGLNFDSDAERKSRTEKVEFDKSKALRDVGRNFALKSGGTKQGRALSRASAIEGAAIGAKAAIETDISQRQGAEQRANLQALQSVQQQVDQGDVTAAQLSQGEQALAVQADQLGLARDQLTETIRQFDATEDNKKEQFFAQLKETATTNKAQLQLQRDELNERVSQGDEQAIREQQALDARIRQQDAMISLDRDQFVEMSNQFKATHALEQEKQRATQEQRLIDTGFRNKEFAQRVVEHDAAMTQRKEEFSRQFGLSEDQFKEAVSRANIDDQFRATEFGQRVYEYQTQQIQRDMEFSHKQETDLRALAQQDDRNAEATRQFDETLQSRREEIANQFGISMAQLHEATEARLAGNDIENERLAFAERQFKASHDEAIRQYDEDLEFQKGRASAEDVFTRAGITGELDGGATLARLHQIHDQKMTEAQIFSEPMPILMGQQELVALGTAITEAGGQIGPDSPQWNSAMDVDGNGFITQAEAQDLSNNQEDLGNGILALSPRTRSTIARETLGLENDKFREGIALSKDQLKTNKEQWASAFVGKKMRQNENGSMVIDFVRDEDGKWRSATSADQERHEAELTEMERRTNSTAIEMASRIGLVPDNDLVAMDAFLNEVGSDGVIGGTHMPSFLLSNPDVKKNLPAGTQTDLVRGKPHAIKAALEIYAEGEGLNPADIGRQFLIRALPDEQKTAFGNTVSQAIFGAQFTPAPKGPSGLAGALGTAASIAGAFLG